MIFLVILFLCLLTMSAFFSSCETTLFSLSRVQLLRLKGKKTPAAAKIVRVLRKPRQILTTILLGNEFVNVCISIVGTTIVGRLVHETANLETLISIGVVTPCVLVFGEIVPKTLAIRLAWDLAPITIHPLTWLHQLIAPIRKSLVYFSDAIIRAGGGKPEANPPMIMEEEYRRMIDDGARQGALIEEERKLIHNVFEFGDKEVRDIMTPRDQIQAIPIDISHDELLLRVSTANKSRIPIYRQNFDDVVGILHQRDLLAYNQRKKRGIDQKLSDIILAPLFVSPNETLDELLHRFQACQLHLALVVEKDKVVGLVTLDDVLAELFGEMERAR